MSSVMFPLPTTSDFWSERPPQIVFPISEPAVEPSHGRENTDFRSTSGERPIGEIMASVLARYSLLEEEDSGEHYSGENSADQLTTHSSHTF